MYVAAMAGNYVNFGVFELYGDRALADALDVSLKMTLSIPLSDVLAYRKVCFGFINEFHSIFHYALDIELLSRLKIDF